MSMMLPARMSGNTPISSSRDRAKRGVGVERREHLMAGHGSAKGHLGSVRIADFADQNDVRVLTQQGTDAIGKSSLVDSATEVWCTRGIGYSTGSSRVMMFTSSALMWWRIE